jgi:Cd2+/Zn2+-exporting ATPase
MHPSRPQDLKLAGLANGRAPLGGAVQTALCLLLLLAGWTLGRSPLATGAFALAYLAGGLASLVAAAVALVHGRLTVDLLMVTAAAGAAAIGDWVEGGVLPPFIFSTRHGKSNG